MKQETIAIFLVKAHETPRGSAINTIMQNLDRKFWTNRFFADFIFASHLSVGKIIAK